VKRARYHPSARDELRAAVAYDEAERPGRGLALEEAVRRVLHRIQQLPQSAPRWPRVESPYEIRRAKVRRHPYLVVYAVLSDQLVVLAVAHTSKQPGYWRERAER
jgi:plasmid stabilization system protein ParE